MHLELEKPLKPDYVYILTEEGGDPSLVKIGHSVDPINRLSGYKAGNYRRLVILFTILGGQELEAEIHVKFAENRIGSGGDEWFKLTPGMVDYLQYQMKKVLVGSDTILVYHKRYFGGPIRIPTVELGEVEAAPVRPTTRVNSVQPHSISEAQPPKSPYSKVGQKVKLK